MSEVSADPRVDLALRRTELALERTHLAWIRTAFMLISSGLALDKSLSALSEARLLEDKSWVYGGHVCGMLLSAVASVLLAVATVQYLGRSRELTRVLDSQSARFPTALALSILVVLLGIAVVILMLLWG